MKFTGATLTINPADNVLVMESTYDTFDKNTSISAPQGWSVIVYQNGKHATNIRGGESVKLISRKYDKKYYTGIKFPLFGAVKLRIIFVRTSFKGLVKVDNKKIEVQGKKLVLSAYFTYQADFKQVNPFVDFMKNLKLKPGKDGVVMTIGDFSYVIETVLPTRIIPGDAGYATRTRTVQEKNYLQLLTSTFTGKVLQPIGWEGSNLNVSYFSIKA